MRRPHRSIETFDISLMAVVTKAMGAFLVLMLLLLPYYTPNKLTQEDVQDILEQLKMVRDRIEQVSQKLGPDTGGQGVQESLKEATSQLEFTAEVVRKLRALLDKSLAEIARLEAENKRLDTENRQLAEDNQNLKTDLQKAEQEIAELKDEIERLRKKLIEGDREIVAALSIAGCNDVSFDGLFLRPGREGDFSWANDKKPIKPEHLFYINLSNGGEISRQKQKKAARFVNQGPLAAFSFIGNYSLLSYSSSSSGNILLVALVKEKKLRYRFRDTNWRPLTATSRACKLEFTLTAKVAGTWTAMRPRSAILNSGTMGAVLAALTSDKDGITFRQPNKTEVEWFDKLLARSLREQRRKVKDRPKKIEKKKVEKKQPQKKDEKKKP